MICEWDDKKNEQNIRKHKLDFRDADKVLQQIHLLFEDTRKDYGECRMIAVGHLLGRMVVIVYTRRGNYYRIISMRKANEREQNKYQDRFKSVR